MSTDQILTFAVAAIGLLGILGSQVIQDGLSRRREAQRSDEERRTRRNELLLETKMRRFAEYMQTLSRLYETLKLLHRPGVATDRHDSIRRSAQDLLDRLYLVETDIRLIAYEVVPATQAAFKSAQALRRASPADGALADPILSDLKQARKRVEAAFQKALH